MTRRGITRRGFLASTVAAGTVVTGGWLASRRYFEESRLPHLIPGEPLALTPAGKLLDTDFPDPFAGGEFLGYLPFEAEGEHVPWCREIAFRKDMMRGGSSTWPRF